MKENLPEVVKGFLRGRLEPGRTLILGLSGGVDSLSLFHMLLDVKRKLEFDLHVAHVDHSWRKESQAEALCLKKYVEGLNVPFHLHVLKKEIFNDGNAEEIARVERIKFFQKLYRGLNAQALLLAHQKEDLAETVLKRIFEGSHLLSLAGMKEDALLEGMRVWRPLLALSKKELVKYGEGRDFLPIEDATNEDVKFLRARMRKEIFPHLEGLFGKNIVSNLCALSEQASSLSNHFEKKFAICDSLTKEGLLGSFVSSKHLDDFDEFELNSFLKFWLSKRNCPASRQVVKLAAEAIISKRNKEFPLNNKTLYIDKQGIFLCRSIPKLEDGAECDWSITWEEVAEYGESSSWMDMFDKGILVAFLPKGEYQIRSRFLQSEGGIKENLRAKYAQHGVPFFLRPTLPFVFQGDVLIHEFSTQKKLPLEHAGPYIKLSIQLRKIDK